MRHKIKRQIARINGHKLAAVFIVAIGLIAATVIVRSRETAAADLKLCHLQQQDRNVLRSILVLARTASRHSGNASSGSEAFYRAALALAPKINCQALPSVNPFP